MALGGPARGVPAGGARGSVVPADGARGVGRWSAEVPTDRGRKPAGGLRMARGDWWCRRMACDNCF